MDENPYKSPECEPERKVPSPVEPQFSRQNVREAVITALILLIVGAILIALVSVGVYNA